MLRSMLHFQHPRSPLSSTKLVKQAFFTPQTPDADVREHERWMPAFESARWPLGMLHRFCVVENVLSNLVNWRSRRDKVFVMGASDNVMVDIGLTGQTAENYQHGV
jgi:hypothetical protein